MKIIELRAENVKRLKAVRIRPDGSMVQITGRNAQGKSSVLDAIAMALGGKSEMPPRPVRDGAESAEVVVDLGELIVERRWTADDKTYLAVKSADGAKYPSPQAILDKLAGTLSLPFMTFDPLAFVRQPPAEQAKIIAHLAGVDLDDWKRESDRLYQERRDAKRKADDLLSRLKTMPDDPDAPTAVVDVAALIKERNVIEEQRRENDRVREDFRSAGYALERARRELATAEERYNKLSATHAALSDLETTELDQRIAGAAEQNGRVFAAEERARLVGHAEMAVSEAAKLHATLEAHRKSLGETIASADLPVSDLSIAPGDGALGAVHYKGLPLEQASSAEQLEVAVAIRLAMNPELRVLLIRDGSLLDSEHLAMLARIAEERDAQVWIERVAGDGEPVGVVIEDGEVVS